MKEIHSQLQLGSSLINKLTRDYIPANQQIPVYTVYVAACCLLIAFEIYHHCLFGSICVYIFNA